MKLTLWESDATTQRESSACLRMSAWLVSRAVAEKRANLWFWPRRCTLGLLCPHCNSNMAAKVCMGVMNRAEMITVMQCMWLYGILVSVPKPSCTSSFGCFESISQFNKIAPLVFNSCNIGLSKDHFPFTGLSNGVIVHNSSTFMFSTRTIAGFTCN